MHISWPITICHIQCKSRQGSNYSILHWNATWKHHPFYPDNVSDEDVSQWHFIELIWSFLKAIKFSDSQSETQIVNLKDKKTLTCEATPDGLTYSWFYNGDRISTTSELQTADFTKDSSGIYTCRVDNSLGTAKNIEPNAAEEKDFQIEIQYPPVVTTDPADEAVVVEGKTFINT